MSPSARMPRLQSWAAATVLVLACGGAIAAVFGGRLAAVVLDELLGAAVELLTF